MSDISCERVTLRHFKDEDLSALESMLADLEVMKFTGFGNVQSSVKAKELLAKWKDDKGVWGAFEKNTHDFVGWFMLKRTNSVHPEIGFMLPRAYWSKGYATEIASALIKYGKEIFHDEKIVASVNRTNTASIKVLLKIGMREASVATEAKDLKFFEI